jgi:tetratricopeptide (TPR) repeat protein
VASWLALVILGGWLAATQAADEQSASKGDEPSAGGVAAAQIDRLVAELDAPRFSDRQSASQKLAAMGAAATAALEKAARGESLEVTTRAIELLKKLLDSSQESAQADARQALQRLAKGDRPKAARLAEEALKAKEQEDAANAMQGRRFGIQIAGGMNAQQIRVQNNNGRREINVQEGDRKIKINDGNGQPIKIEVTTKTNGKESTEKYEAKDVDELKKKHPEAYKIYKAWENQGNVFGLQGVGGINVVQVIGPAAPFQPPPDVQVRAAIGVLGSLHRHVANLINGDQVKKASPQTRADLQQAVDQLKQTLADVEKRLQEKPAAPAAKPEGAGEAKKPQ